MSLHLHGDVVPESRLMQLSDYSNYNNGIYYFAVSLHNKVWNYDNLDKEWANLHQFHYNVASPQISMFTQPLHAARQPAPHKLTFGSSQCLVCTMQTVWHALVDRHTHSQTYTQTSQPPLRHTHTDWCTSRHSSHYYPHHPNTLSLSHTHSHSDSELPLLKHRTAPSG